MSISTKSLPLYMSIYIVISFRYGICLVYSSIMCIRQKVMCSVYTHYTAFNSCYGSNFGAMNYHVHCTWACYLASNQRVGRLSM